MSPHAGCRPAKRQVAEGAGIAAGRVHAEGAVTVPSMANEQSKIQVGTDNDMACTSTVKEGAMSLRGQCYGLSQVSSWDWHYDSSLFAVGNHQE